MTDDPTISRTRLSFIIALNDTGSAGLGISVKGRAQKDLTSGVSSDTGVFVKNVINGGAAWKVRLFQPTKFIKTRLENLSID